METRFHKPNNRDGWSLDLKQTWNPDTFVPSRRPIAMIPGYGMNAFILGYHPNGLSLEAFLADAGFEVWSVNLRGQGDSRRHSGPRSYGFKQLALVDLPTGFDTIRHHSLAEPTEVDVVGCSLGATITYAYLGHHAADGALGSVVSIGGPLRWENPHPLMRLVFLSPRLAGAVPIRGTRKLARFALPIAQKVPAILSLYMNPSIIDLSKADKFVQTVDDPNPHLNRQIACWFRDRDLIVEGVNITAAMSAVSNPMMCILANKDGIVPPESVLSVVDAIGTEDVEVLTVGDERIWFAHADLFISRYAQAQVFKPLAEWLVAQP